MDSTRLWIPSGGHSSAGMRTASTSGADRTAWNISRQRPKSDDAGRMAKAIDIFTSMCRYNTKHKGADDASVVTPFHSVAEPPVSLTVYMDRVDVQTNCGEEGVLLGMILIGRYFQNTKVMPSVLSMHRLLLVATRIAVKAHHDVFRSNRTYARAGGLDLREVNDLELYLLAKLDYKVVISHEQLKHLRNQLTLASSATTDAVLATHVMNGIDPNAIPPQPHVMPAASSQHVPSCGVDGNPVASGAAAVAVRAIRGSANLATSGNTNNTNNNPATNTSRPPTGASSSTLPTAGNSGRSGGGASSSLMSPSSEGNQLQHHASSMRAGSRNGRGLGGASGSTVGLLSPGAPPDDMLMTESVNSQGRGVASGDVANRSGRRQPQAPAANAANSGSRGGSGRPQQL